MKKFLNFLLLSVFLLISCHKVESSSIVDLKWEEDLLKLMEEQLGETVPFPSDIIGYVYGDESESNTNGRYFWFYLTYPEPIPENYIWIKSAEDETFSSSWIIALKEIGYVDNGNFHQVDVSGQKFIKDSINVAILHYSGHLIPEVGGFTLINLWKTVEVIEEDS